MLQREMCVYCRWAVVSLLHVHTPTFFPTETQISIRAHWAKPSDKAIGNTDAFEFFYYSSFHHGIILEHTVLFPDTFLRWSFSKLQSGLLAVIWFAETCMLLLLYVCCMSVCLSITCVRVCSEGPYMQLFVQCPESGGGDGSRQLWLPQYLRPGGWRGGGGWGEKECDRRVRVHKMASLSMFLHSQF